MAPAGAARGAGGGLDVFLSHAWDEDLQGRDTHARVCRIADALQKRGVSCWLDEERMKGNLTRSMISGIDGAELFVALATRRYMDKVNDGSDDPSSGWNACRKEFEYAAAKKWRQRILVVVMEPEMLSQNAWDGVFLMEVGRDLYFDFSNDEGFEGKVDALARLVRDKISGESPQLDTRLGAGRGAEGSASGSPAQALAAVERTLSVGFDALAMATYKAKEFMPGTRQWIFDAIDTWYRAKQWRSRVFVLIGLAGIGKSVFCAELVRLGGALDRANAADGGGEAAGSAPAGGDKSSTKSSGLLSTVRRSLAKRGQKKKPATQAKATEGPPRVVAAHFFKHDDAKASNPRLCLLSLAAQLARHVPGLAARLAQLDRPTLDSEPLQGLFQRLLSEPLAGLPAPGGRVLVVLDALDECAVAGRKEFLTVLQQSWMDGTPEWLGLVASTRPEDYIPYKLQAFSPVELQTEDHNNTKDMDSYLRAKLAPLMARKEEVDPAVAIMIERSEGLFLYARFMQDTLASLEPGALHLHDIESTDTFPRGLSGFYARYFARLFKTLGEDTYRAMLSPVVAARAPLPISALQAIMKLSPRKVRSVVKKARQLLYVAEDSLRLVHKSMSDWLTDYDNPEEDLCVEIELGHQRLAVWCASERTDPFAYQHCLYHLACAGQTADACERLLDPRWLQDALLKGLLPKQIIIDWNSVVAAAADANSREMLDATLSVRCIEKSAAALLHDPLQLVSQMLGRLSDDHPLLRPGPAALFRSKKRWLRPLSKSLEHADSALRKTLRGHRNGVLDVCFDKGNGGSGGSRLVTGSRDGTLRTWDPTTGELLQTVEAHRSFVYGVAAHEGRLLSGSNDNTLVLWPAGATEASDGLIARKTKTYGVRSLLLLGDLVVTGWEDSKIFVHSAAGDGAPVKMAEMKHQTGKVVGLHAADGLLASCCSDRSVRLWRTSEWSLVREDRDHGDTVCAVLIDPVRNLLFSASADRYIRIVWLRQRAEQSRRLVHVIKDHTNGVSALAQAEEMLFSAGRDGLILVHAMNTWELLVTLRAHTDDVTRLLHLPSEQLLVSCSHDRTVKIWDVASVRETAQGRGAQAEARSGHAQRVFAVEILAGDLVVSASQIRSLCLWDRTNGELLDRVQAHATHVLAMTASSELDAIVTAGSDYKVNVYRFRARKLELAHALVGHQNWVHVVKIHQGAGGAAWVLSGGRDQTVRVWDLATGAAVHVLKGHTEYITALDAIGDDVVSASRDRTLRVWSLSTGAVKRVMRGHEAVISSAWIRPSTREVFSRGDDETARRWALDTGECLEAVETNTDDLGGGVGPERIRDDFSRLPQTGVAAELTMQDRSGFQLDWIGGRGVGFTCDSEVRVVVGSDDGRMVVLGTDAGKVHLLAVEEPLVFQQ